MTTLKNQNPISTCEMTVKKKCRIRNVVPNIAWSTVQSYQKCFLEFSLENQQFDNPKLDAMMRWIDARFKSCAVLMGDSIHRLTMQINKNIDEATALEEAAYITRRTIERAESIIEVHKNSCDFKIILCSDVQKWSEYNMYYKQLANLFMRNEKFSESVMNFTRHFLLRKGLIDMPRSIDLSIQYFFEEAAICACMKKLGYLVLISPGSLTMLEEISNHQYTEAPAELKELINISLDIV